MLLFFYKKKCDAADSPFFLITYTSKSVNKLCVNKRAGVVAHKEEKDIAQMSGTSAFFFYEVFAKDGCAVDQIHKERGGR